MPDLAQPGVARDEHVEMRDEIAWTAHAEGNVAPVEAFAGLVEARVPSRRRCGEAPFVIKRAEAVMDAVSRIRELLKTARTSWMTPFMGGACAGVFLFWA